MHGIVLGVIGVLGCGWDVVIFSVISYHIMLSLYHSHIGCISLYWMNANTLSSYHMVVRR